MNKKCTKEKGSKNKEGGRKGELSLFIVLPPHLPPPPQSSFFHALYFRGNRIKVNHFYSEQQIDI